MRHLDEIKEKVRELMMEFDFIHGMEVERAKDGSISVILRVDCATSVESREQLPKEILGEPVLLGEVRETRYGPTNPQLERWANRYRS